MADTPDSHLLEQFVRNSSEDAFKELVQRHIGLVHSVALRHTTNPQHAEDITQAVFIILARKADKLHRKTVLAGWLYRTAQLTAANWQRTESRRIHREQEAFMQSQLEDPANDNLWRELSPQLDQAMASLGTIERDALVLRYFQNKRLVEVGESLGLTENAAQKRIRHALEKLQKFFTRRGVNSTATSIAESISIHSIQAAPIGLAKGVAATALAKGAIASASTLTLIKGALKIMAWAKAKNAIVAGAFVLLAVGTASILLKELPRPGHDVEHYFQTIGIPMTNGTWAEFNKIPPNLFVLRRTRYADFLTPNGITGTSTKDRAIGRNLDLSNLMKSAYNFYYPHGGGTGVVLLAEAPNYGFDFLSTGPDALKKLQAEITRQLGYTASKELRNVDAYALILKNTNAPGLKLSNGHHPQKGLFDWSEISSDTLVFFLESHFDLPIVNQTGLNGQFDVGLKDFTWDYTNEDKSRTALRQVMRDQLGLELIKTNLPIEMLVVRKAK